MNVLKFSFHFETVHTVKTSVLKHQSNRKRLQITCGSEQGRSNRNDNLHTSKATLESEAQCTSLFIHSFIPAISIAPLQVLYYSEALPTIARILYRSFTPKRTGNCR